MRSEASIRTVSAILIAALGFACLVALPAQAVDRGTISLRGSVLAEDGAPLADTWVFSKGSRRVSALTADDGSYLLDIPGGTVAEQIRAPLELRIMAQRRGWRIRLADGAPELLLELRILVDPDGTARLRVRSSDPAIATALAGETVTSGGPTATLNLDFRAVHEPDDEPGSVKLTAVEEVVLTGVELPPGQPSAARPGPIVIPTGLRAGTRTSTSSHETEAAGEETPEPPAVTKAPKRAPKPAVGTPPDGAETKIAPQEPKQKKAKKEEPKKEKKQKQPKGQERLGKAKKEMTPEPPAQETKDTEPGPPSSPRVYRPAEPASGAPPAEPRVYRPALPSSDAPQNDGGAPRVYRPAEGRAREPEPESPQRPRVIRSSETALFDSLATSPDTAGTAKSPATPTPSAPPATSPSVPAPAAGQSEAPPPARASEPVRTEEPAARAPEPVQAPPEAPGQAPEPDAWCTCRVEGFVEIRSEQRINGFLRVRVWLDGHPEFHGEVELFMGSPRGFVLRSVPCGPQKVRFEVRSKQSFELISPEPKVDCTDGGVRQVRLVLQPSKGRGR